MVCFLIPVVNFVIVRHDLSRSTFVFSDGKVNTEGIGIQFVDSVPIAVIIFKERLNTTRIILRDLFEQRRVDDFTKIRIQGNNFGRVSRKLLKRSLSAASGRHEHGGNHRQSNRFYQFCFHVFSSLQRLGQFVHEE